jgi:hypothetical protein
MLEDEELHTTLNSDQFFGEPDIINEIKARRVSWMGHLFRVNEHHPCRLLTFTVLPDIRRVGRPPVRWLEIIEEDLRNIGVGIWKIMTMGRKKWRIITGAAKARTRL